MENLHRLFELFGDRMVAMHAKDFVLEDKVVKMYDVVLGNLKRESRLLTYY